MLCSSILDSSPRSDSNEVSELRGHVQQDACLQIMSVSGNTRDLFLIEHFLRPPFRAGIGSEKRRALVATSGVSSATRKLALD